MFKNLFAYFDLAFGFDAQRTTFYSSKDFEDCAVVKAIYKDDGIGIAKLARNDSEAIIGDIQILDHKRIVFTWLPRPRLRFNYRNKGIGSMLLGEVIAYCRRHDITTIKGTADGDIEKLIPWYQANGFEIKEGNQIFMELN